MDPNKRSAASGPRPPRTGGYISDVMPARVTSGPTTAGAPPSKPTLSNAFSTDGQTQVPRSTAPSTTIAFHVPGVRAESDEPALTSPHPMTTFDRDAPPPIAPRSDNPTGKHRQGLRDLLSIVGVLASALLLAFCLITFVFQSYQVDGPSMQTTLQNSDHLIVWKVERSWANITHHSYIPNRGDVIVFNEPNLSDFGQDSGKQLIKRVIGLPGERVVVKDGVITIYNQQHPEGFEPDKTLPYGKVIVTTPGNVDVTLASNQVYACGDNRTNSLDSRVFGPVDASNIVGKLVLRVLPLNTIKKF